MKTTFSRASSVLAAVAASFISSLPASGTTYTWAVTQPGTFDWDYRDPFFGLSNWDPPSGFPNAFGDVAKLTNDITGDQTVNLNEQISLGELDVGSAGGRFTIAPGTAGGSFVINDGTGVGYVYHPPGPIRGTQPAVVSADIITPELLKFVNEGETTLSISGRISGSGIVDVLGAFEGTNAGATGPLEFLGNNTYLGPTAIGMNGAHPRSGTLVVSSDQNLGRPVADIGFASDGDNTTAKLTTTASFTTNRTVRISGFATFDVQSGTTLTESGTITGDGGLIIEGGGTLVLSGNNDFRGGTLIDAGTLRVASDASLGAPDGGIVFTGLGSPTLETTASFSTARYVTMTFKGIFLVSSGTLTENGTISGDALTMTTAPLGAGVLALGGNNTYLGPTTISGGTVSVSSDANLGEPHGPIVFNAPVQGTLQTTATFTTNRHVTLAGATNNLDVAPGTTLFMNGPIDGPGGLTLTNAGALELRGTNTYAGGTVLAGGGKLIVSSDANLGDSAGPLTFTSVTPATLVTRTSFTTSRNVALLGAAVNNVFLVDPGTTLTENGTLSGGGGLTVFGDPIAGPGTLVLGGNNSYAGPTMVDGRTLVFNSSGALPVGSELDIGFFGRVRVAHTATPNAITIRPGALMIGFPPATLDLTDNALRMDYGAGPSPLASIRSYLTTGYNNGAWNGPGIITSSGDATHTLGYADSADGVVKNLPANTVLVEFARVGDADLDGVVDFSDLVAVARNYGKSNATWEQGDFNYDGKVGFDDLVAVARNYGGTLTAAQLATFDPSIRSEVQAAFAQLPEPGILVFVPAVGLGLLRHRRKIIK